VSALVPKPHTLRVAVVAAASLCLVACHKTAYPCRGDSDCPADQVCFPDGCGDPARGIRIEASPSTAGRAARDIALDEVRSRQDLQLSYPPTLQGSISALAPDPPRMQPYSDYAVAVHGLGESEIIPGLTRTFDITLPTGDSNPEGSLRLDGTFSIAVSPGVYSITVSTLDPNLPPASAGATIALRSGEISTVDLSFGPLGPAVPLLIQVSGPSAFEAQAFSDAINLRPLSQRGTVPPARQFDLSPAVHLNPTFVVQVSPRDPAALIPQKTFGPFPSNPIPPGLELAMGGWGAPVTVTGTVVDGRGAAIAGVTVYVDGPVGGGGTFRSQSVQTDDSGTFSLTTLASASGSTSNFWAIPPAQSGSGILRSALAIPGPMALGNITCPDKVIAQGVVFTNDESSAPGVRVMAAPVQQLPGHPLPGAGDQTTTDEIGAFSLKLDPAIYRLDFIPGGQLPRTSRFAAVPADPASSGGYRTVQVADVFLSKARKIIGVVSAVPSQEVGIPTIAPFTRLRFFRVTTGVDGRLTSTLLAETVADSTGRYSVYLPTR
jgi:hypothetical protein